MGLFIRMPPDNSRQPVTKSQTRELIMKMTDQQKRALVKRLTDFLEKSSVASLAVGIFQGVQIGIIIGILAFLGAAYLTYKENK